MTPCPALSYRFPWRGELLDPNGDPTGLPTTLELIADDFLHAASERRADVARLAARYQIVPHCIAPGFGGVDPLPEQWLHRMEWLLAEVRATRVTAHLAFTAADGREVGHLVPLPLDAEALDVVVQRVKQWTSLFSLPISLENITREFEPGGVWTEAEFLRRVVEQAGCGLLLDLHNLYTNWTNAGITEAEMLELLETYPLAAVTDVHLAGGHWSGGFWIDGHSSPCPTGVWSLLRHLLDRANPQAVILEWDVNLPPLAEAVSELRKVGACFAGSDRGAAAA